MSCDYPGDDTDFAVSIGYKNNHWWTGLVRDHDPRTGEVRLRLLRGVRHPRRGWERNQTWRVRSDYWSPEQSAIEAVMAGEGTTSPPKTPTDPSIDVQRYLEVRRDDIRWVAAVHVYNENKGTEQTRLYHWDPQSWSRRQCWTVGPDWPKVTRLATQHLPSPA